MRDGWLNFHPPLPPQGLISRPRSLPFPFDDPRHRVYDFGRNALWQGLGALGLGAGDEVLMPAYHCGTEVAAVVDRGLVPRFWAGTEKIEPDPGELARLLGPRTRALYLIHYLGLAQDAPRWRRWCDEHGLLLIEDVAPGWPAALDGRPLGSWGDISIFSPWKTFGLPDCGVLLCAGAPPEPALTGIATKHLVKGFLRWPLQRSAFAARRMNTDPAEAFDPSIAFSIEAPERGASRGSMFLLPRISRPSVPAARRRNWDWLRERLGEHMVEAFRRPAEEGSPLGLPIDAEDKQGFLRHLAENGIRGLNFWAVAHPSLARDSFPHLDRLHRTTVVLPVHQGLRPRDLDRLARVGSGWFRGRPGPGSARVTRRKNRREGLEKHE